MPTCIALFCNHDSRKERCQMFKFPSNPDLRKQWLNNTRRSDFQLKPSSRICSCHFVRGKKQLGPTLFAWSSYISKIRRDLDKGDDSLDSQVALTSEQFNLPDENISTTGLEVEVRTELNGTQVKEGPVVLTEITPFVQSEVPNPLLMNNHTLVKLRVDNLILKHEIDETEKHLESLKNSSNNYYERLTFEKLNNDLEILKYYTGLDKFESFWYLADIIKNSNYDLKYNKWAVVSLPINEQLFMTLMKLRTNFGYCDIAYRFRVSACTVKNIIWTFVDALHALLYEKKVNQNSFPYYLNSGISLPKEFENFSNCRILLGSIEVDSEISRSSIGGEFRHKKLRSLVGISPFGNFIFASEFYTDNISSREIVKRSLLLNHLSSGDLILTSEALCIQDLLPPGIDVNVPLLTHDDSFLTEAKIHEFLSGATACLHSSIKKLKEFSILDKVTLAYRPKATKLLQACCALVNVEFTEMKDSDILTLEIDS